MAPNDQGEFVQVQRRKSSSHKKYNNNQKYHNSFTSQNSSAQRSANPTSRSKATAFATSAPSAISKSGRWRIGSRRSSTSSVGSEVSVGGTDCDEDDDDPAISSPFIDLGEEGIQTGLLLEMLILEAFAQHPEMTLFKCHGGIKHLRFAHSEGDIFTWLAVTRQWVANLQQGNADTWFTDNNIQESTLRHVENYVELRRKYLVSTFQQRLRLAFGKDSDISNELILNIIIQKYGHNISVYQGHPSLGYKVLGTGETVHLHKSSSVHFLTKLPKYIIFIDKPDPKTSCVKAVCILNGGLAESLLSFNSSSNTLNDFIKKNQVKPCIFPSVGESIGAEVEKLWNTGNAYFSPLKEYFGYQCNNSALLFKFSQQQNQVIIFALPEYHETIKTLMHEEIKKIKNKFKDECLDIGFPDEKSHVRIQMGPGAENKRFLLPQDFRSVWVHETQAGTLTTDFVLEEMEKFGKVSDIVLSDNATKEEIGVWGTVTFHDPSDVIKLLSSTKLHNAAMLVELAPNSGHEYNMKEAVNVAIERGVKIQLKLCRRPAKSSLAFVHIRGRRDYSIFLNTKSFSVGNRRISISTCPGKAELIQLSGLDQMTEVKELEKAIREKLGINFEKVEIDRPPPFASSAEDLHKFKTSLQRLVDKAVDMSKVSIRIFMPSPDDLYFKAELKFETRRIAISALDYIVGAKVRGLPMQIESNPMEDPSVPVVTIKVLEDIYNVVRSEMKKQLSRLPRGLDVKSVTKGGFKEFHLFSQNIIEVESTASRLEAILSPKSLRMPRTRIDFLLGDGEAFLNTLMAETKTYIHVSKEKRQLDIYGSKDAVHDATKIVVDNIDQLKQIPDDAGAYIYKIPLDAPDMPPTMMIEVAKDLDNLLERTEVQDLKIDIKSHSLCYSATDESHFAMQATIESMKDLVAANSLVISSDIEDEETCVNTDGVFDCSACYCPIEGTAISLQSCGHHYCEECIDTHLKVSLENKAFPISCVDESCGQPICVRDMIVLSRRAERGTWKLLKATAEHYIQTRPKEYGFCHKADCQGVVHKQPGVGYYHCLICYSKVCPKCMNNFHGGQSCEDYLSNASFQQWLAASNDRKKCTNCTMPIEKVDGCNRIHCTSCKREICWKCLAHFPDMRLAYDHLMKEHNGYF